MEIKDFIKEALLQIVDGVSNANNELKSKGAYIPTTNIAGDDVLATLEQEKHRTKNGSSDISSDKVILYKKKTAVNFVYLNNHKQMYKNEQQFSISCLGSIHP